ncbi:hypothetical protein HK099_000994 [Clydaea vesicula]|uniref:Phosphoglycerate mutase family protein n=1 Tax=Clydaea vesicula TaxID=447962 RepID=A0AAD5XW82_9FUNG|nr:hypothetical protein HK099_000994 [Clydaea vesicula]
MENAVNDVLLEVYLFRHAERIDFADENWILCKENEPFLYNPPITKSGIEKTKLLASKIKLNGQPIVYTSPFDRCIQTALAFINGNPCKCTKSNHHCSVNSKNQILPLPTPQKNLKIEYGFSEFFTPTYFKKKPDIPTLSEIKKKHFSQQNNNSTCSKQYLDLTYDTFMDIPRIFPESYNGMISRINQTFFNLVQSILSIRNNNLENVENNFSVQKVPILLFLHADGINSILNYFVKEDDYQIPYLFCCKLTLKKGKSKFYMEIP